MITRSHHFISQFYLRGFTNNGSKKSKLSVIDLEQRKYFETNTRNVAAIRDFNRVNVEGLKPDAVEADLSNYENRVAKSFKKVNDSLLFSGEDKLNILSLISLFSVRNPAQRENRRKGEEEVMNLITKISLESKDRWEALSKRNLDNSQMLSYEQAKIIQQTSTFKLEVPNEQNIHKELLSSQQILKTLVKRKWTLIEATIDSGFFITSDNPVSLSWIDPEKIPLFYRNSPGFAGLNTTVYFPISKRLALIGEYSGRDGHLKVDKKTVATLNTFMLKNTQKQVYCYSLMFDYLWSDGSLIKGNTILSTLNHKT